VNRSAARYADGAAAEHQEASVRVAPVAVNTTSSVSEKPEEMMPERSVMRLYAFA
jgi:hypothetical protein